MFRNIIFPTALAMSAVMTSAAQAHPGLAAASPAADTTAIAPTRIQIGFTEALVAPLSGIDLTMTEMPGMKMGPMKMKVAKTALAPDGKTLVATFARPLPTGTYRVDYHIVSADTHHVEGSYMFKVQ